MKSKLLVRAVESWYVSWTCISFPATSYERGDLGASSRSE
jgi:hypothetical protein